MRICLEDAVLRVRTGEVIAVPTDTVYGLVAAPGRSDAVQSLYLLKERPRNKPCILLGATHKQLAPLAEWMPSGFVELADAFWPGALTLVVPASYTVPQEVRLGRADIGLRIPACGMTRELCRRCGPLAAPSANPSGERPALSALEVEAYFGANFPVLDAKTVPCGLASTILVAENERWAYTRPGAVEREELAPVLGYWPEPLAHIRQSIA